MHARSLDLPFPELPPRERRPELTVNFLNFFYPAAVVRLKEPSFLGVGLLGTGRLTVALQVASQVASPAFGGGI